MLTPLWDPVWPWMTFSPVSWRIMILKLSGFLVRKITLTTSSLNLCSRFAAAVSVGQHKTYQTDTHGSKHICRIYQTILTLESEKRCDAAVQSMCWMFVWICFSSTTRLQGQRRRSKDSEHGDQSDRGFNEKHHICEWCYTNETSISNGKTALNCKSWKNISYATNMKHGSLLWTLWS